MKKTLLKLTCLAVTLALCFGLVACGGGNSSSAGGSAGGGTDADGPKAPEDYVGEIVFWSWSESETLGLAEKFNEVYPNIKIKFVPTDSSGFATKFQTALVSGSEVPDVCLQEVGERGAMFALDCWENLEAAPYNVDRSIFFPQILPLMTNDRDEIIGIERELNPSGMYYKRELAEQWLGTGDPDEIAALMMSDWDQFIEIGKKVAADSGGTVKLMAGIGDLASMLPSQYDKPVFDGDDAYITEFYEYSLDLMIRAYEAGIVGEIARSTPSWNASHTDDTTIFYGCAPWSGQWIIKPNDPDSKFTWGITSAPLRSYNWGGTAYGIPTAAKNKELAWLFIEWATTTDHGTAACEEVVGAIVSRQSNYVNGVAENPDPFYGGQTPNAYLMEKCAPSMLIRPVHQYDSILNDVMQLMIEMIQTTPGITTEQAVATAVTETANKLPASVTVH